MGPSERPGAAVTCSGCGASGRQRLRDDGPLEATSWACSAKCAEKLMEDPKFGVIGWMKRS